jgi:hypothetical protein
MHRQARERIIALEVLKLELRQAAERAQRTKEERQRATALRHHAPRGHRTWS